MPQPDLDIWWRHPHLQNGAHAEKHEGKSLPGLFAATRSVFSPCYFESYGFRQWEIRGVKKKCRLMNVCAFSRGRKTEHESFFSSKKWRTRRKTLLSLTLLSLFKSCYQGREYALQSEDSHLWEKTSSWSLLSHNAFLHSWSSFSISYNFVSVNHYPWQFNILQRKLMSWAQRHTTLQKTKQNKTTFLFTFKD